MLPHVLSTTSKIPSVVSIIFLPFLAPYRVSAASALIVVFIFWYCIKRLFSLVTPWSLMLFSTSSHPRKIICVFTKIYAISSFIYSHEAGPVKYCNITGSKSGSTWKSYRKVKSYTDSFNKITAAKSK